MSIYDEINIEIADDIAESINTTLSTAITKTAKVRLADCKGSITAVQDSAIHACLPNAKQGQLCHIKSAITDTTILAEITAISGTSVILQPYSTSTKGVSCNDFIIPVDDRMAVLAGDHLKGAIVDGLGNIIEESPWKPSTATEMVSIPLSNSPPDALTRPVINETLSVGVRSIDGLLTIGQGQRLGIFAPAGAGKSTLLGMITRFAEADVVVLGLIGERGREVNEFLHDVLGEEARKHSVVVVSTSDRPAIEKVKAIYTATSIAEYFREQGKKVLLLVDSLTRFARAQRDVAIASGEYIPSTGFPASVFSQLPLVLERAGRSSKGSITALYTVLVEDETAEDVIAEEVRSIVDGHIILSRKLASANHYPAIDVLGSISRVMAQITSEEHKASAGKLRNLLAKYNELELLIRVGEYQQGEDKEADEAVERHSSLLQFLQQPVNVHTSMNETLRLLSQVTGG